MAPHPQPFSRLREKGEIRHTGAGRCPVDLKTLDSGLRRNDDLEVMHH